MPSDRSFILIILIALLAASLTGCGHWKPDRWDALELGMAGALVVSTAIDYGQTSKIARNSDQYVELNPILGRHPSQDLINVYFPVGLAVELGIAHILPHPWRKSWLGLTLGGEITCVIHNHSQVGLDP